jgi:GH18 family chitinase
MYADNGHGATDKPFIMFGQSGQATLGIYVGQGLLNQRISASALEIFEDNLDNLNISTPSLAMQLCGSNYDSTHIFGIMVASDGKFAPIQDAIKSWANATCLSFSGSTRFTGQAAFITPLIPTNATTNSSRWSEAHSMIRKDQVHGKHFKIRPRADCETVSVEPVDSCASLATRCRISPANFTKYNPGASFCANLKPKQHVCCSSGSLPDFSPSPNADGTCYAYQAKANDNCDDLAAQFSLTREKIENFNKNTWGWNGCKLLFVGTNMCLSKGNPPFPAPIANAVCGPQKPGSKPPNDSSDIAKMNACPLNACCNIWGQCGITKDFCIDTNTGAPGTAEPGSYGCISNCGTDIVKGVKGSAIRIGYYEGYGMNRECLFQDASQIDTTQYTHIHFSFGTLTTDYEVEVGGVQSTYQFNEFKRLKGVKRILSFGGWEFSASPATYAIFRDGVTAANRLKMATKIANFIKKHDLDGVDIDWEYPGAPDFPDIPAASKADGPNYLLFLGILKNLLPRKSISIAAPSSYWYLKQFPIKDIGRLVDYIVYMTYDLHGQWDAGNSNSQEGCDNGNCLRSQVNLTETKQSLAMITKAGVPANKVIVGITSYGRSYNMAQPDCWGPNCLYTGGRGNSEATKGKCTDTSGYLADAEIEDIINDKKRAGRVVKSFFDGLSQSDVLVYDQTQWVSYMSSKTKKQRSLIYSNWGMGGTTDWATDLQTFHKVPSHAVAMGMKDQDWPAYKAIIASGQDPKTDRTRNGNWTEFDCTNDLAAFHLDYTPREQWAGLGVDAAWKDVVRIWEDTDKNRDMSFSFSVSSTLGVGFEPRCETLDQDTSCNTVLSCDSGMDGELFGAAGHLIYNSLVYIRGLYKEYDKALVSNEITALWSLDDLQNKFAPIPPEENNTWILVLFDLITVGTLSAAGPFFNSLLKTMPYFINSKDATFDNLKDTTMNLIGQSTTIAKDVLPSKDAPWTPERQASFSNYMGQAIKAWKELNTLSLEKIFDGSPESINLIWKIIKDGKLIQGKPSRTLTESEDKTKSLRDNIGKTLYGYTIPALWRASNTHAFVLDAGNKCGERQALATYLDDETMDATGVCINNRAYYLVYPKGDSKDCDCGGAPICTDKCPNAKFSMPPGLDSLDGEAFGKITKQELVEGSVRTYLSNGRKNVDGDTIPYSNQMENGLLKVDVTTPGYMRIPVCSPERAYRSWDTDGAERSKIYPCDIPVGRQECGDSTFENQSSGASPKIEDCRQIIRNIQEDTTTDFKHSTTAGQRDILHHESCHFGVEATKLTGNINFKVGGQDVIDIINDAIKRFGGDGRVGAKGTMPCNGNIAQQEV